MEQPIAVGKVVLRISLVSPAPGVGLESRIRSEEALIVTSASKSVAALKLFAAVNSCMVPNVAYPVSEGKEAGVVHPSIEVPLYVKICPGDGGVLGRAFP